MRYAEEGRKQTAAGGCYEHLNLCLFLFFWLGKGAVCYYLPEFKSIRALSL